MKNIYVRLGVIGVVVALGATAIAQSLMSGRSKPHDGNPAPIEVSQLPDGMDVADPSHQATEISPSRVVLAANEAPASGGSFSDDSAGDQPPQPSARFRFSDSSEPEQPTPASPTPAASTLAAEDNTPGAAPPSGANRFSRFLADSESSPSNPVETDDQPEPPQPTPAEGSPRPRFGAYGTGGQPSRFQVADSADDDDEDFNDTQDQALAASSDDSPGESEPRDFSGGSTPPPPMRFSGGNQDSSVLEDEPMQDQPEDEPAESRAFADADSPEPSYSATSPPARFVGSGSAEPTPQPRFQASSTPEDDPSPTPARLPAYGAAGDGTTDRADDGPSPPRGFAGSVGSAPAPPSVEGGMAVAARPGDVRWEGSLTPSLTLEKIAPPEIQIGKKATFELLLENVGRIEAQQVVVRDMVPAGTSLVSTSPQAQEAADGSLIWQIGSLSPGEKKTLTMELLPEKEGDVGSVATVSFATMASVKTTVTRPRLSLQQDAPSKVLVGDQLRIAITINNPGTGPATGVVIEENVPGGFSHPAGSELEFEIGTLKPGETRQLDLTLTAEQAARSVNRLIVRADGGLEAEHELDLEVIAPQLEVVIDGPKLRYLDRPAKYTVSVTNPGTAPAQEIDLVTHLPKGLQFVEANNAGQYDSSRHAVLWSLEELPPGQSGTVELVVLPVQSGDQRLKIEGTARMGLTAQHESSVKVEGLAAIFFEVVDLADPIEVGKETTYEIRVVNQGSKEATDVQVVAQLPSGLRGIKADGATRGVIEGNQVVFEPVSRIEPKGTVQFRIQVQGIAPGDQRTKVQVSTQSIQQPITKEESTTVYSD